MEEEVAGRLSRELCRPRVPGHAYLAGSIVEKLEPIFALRHVDGFRGRNRNSPWRRRVPTINVPRNTYIQALAGYKPEPRCTFYTGVRGVTFGI